MEGDGPRAEGEFLVLFGLCRERLESRVLETALVSLCSTRENHEGGEYDVMILATVQTYFLLFRGGFGGGSIHIVSWFKLADCLHGNCELAFLCCHVFPVVSELDYLLLEHVAFSDDLDSWF